MTAFEAVVGGSNPSGGTFGLPNVQLIIIMHMKLPQEIQTILSTLKQHNFEAFVVGGSVRDILRKQTPKDWDITTKALPENIQKLFPKHFYENIFGTVTVLTDSNNETLNKIQITPYRSEESYTDKRHPDKISFGKKLEDDLSRRDFTINAIAMDETGVIVDPFGGEKDIKAKLIRAVGDPNERFSEDALRLMRAVRLSAELGFSIEQQTLQAITQNANGLKMISKERVRDELIKIIMSDGAQEGIMLLHKTGLLKHIIPELEEGVNVTQNKHHIYTVFDHNVFSLGYAVKFGYNFETRLASLLHDVGKPRTKRGEGENATFYGHDVVGARMSAQILERLKFPREIVTKIVTLVRYHLFYYNVGEVTEAAVRRVVRKVGKENIKDLINLRIAERKGSGVPKAKPYKLRHFEFMIEKALHEPIAVTDLAISGHDIMETLRIAPGPKVGVLLNALMNEVIDDPIKNKKEYLLERVVKLHALTESELAELAKEAETKIGESEEQWEDETKKRHFVE